MSTRFCSRCTPRRPRRSVSRRTKPDTLGQRFQAIGYVCAGALAAVNAIAKANPTLYGSRLDAKPSPSGQASRRPRTSFVDAHLDRALIAAIEKVELRAQDVAHGIGE